MSPLSHAPSPSGEHGLTSGASFALALFLWGKGCGRAGYKGSQGNVFRFQRVGVGEAPEFSIYCFTLDSS